MSCIPKDLALILYVDHKGFCVRPSTYVDLKRSFELLASYFATCDLPKSTMNTAQVRAFAEKTAKAAFGEK